MMFNLYFVIGQNKIENCSTVGKYYVSRSFDIMFDNVPNQKVDLYLPKYWGELEISITGSFHYQNIAGIVTKKFALGLNPENKIYENSSRYSEVMGQTKNGFAISDFRWDADKAMYKVTIACISGYKNQISVLVSGLTSSPVYVDFILGMTYSSVYTSDLTKYAKPVHNFVDLVSFNGKVAIGTVNPDSDSKLDVRGKIKATEIEITAPQTADFVFEEDYQLKPLSEVEQFVKENKHLPEIPSAEKMKKDGVNLAEMNKLLLQKVEELTLYLIKLEKSQRQQQNKNIQLEERIINLTQQIRSLKNE